MKETAQAINMVQAYHATLLGTFIAQETSPIYNAASAQIECYGTDECFGAAGQAIGILDASIEQYMIEGLKSTIASFGDVKQAFEKVEGVKFNKIVAQDYEDCAKTGESYKEFSEKICKIHGTTLSDAMLINTPLEGLSSAILGPAIEYYAEAGTGNDLIFSKTWMKQILDGGPGDDFFFLPPTYGNPSEIYTLIGGEGSDGYILTPNCNAPIQATLRRIVGSAVSSDVEPTLRCSDLTITDFNADKDKLYLKALALGKNDLYKAVATENGTLLTFFKTYDELPEISPICEINLIGIDPLTADVSVCMIF